MRSTLMGRKNSNLTLMALAGALSFGASVSLAVPIAYVDSPADFTPPNPANGQMVTWNGQGGPVAGLTYGTDAFGTIQDGLDAASVNGLVLVAPGTYPQNLVINTDGVTLRGPQHTVIGRNRVTNPVSDTVEPTLPTAATEAIIIPSVSNVVDGTLVRVNSDNVTIEGLMFSGLNAGLGGGFHAARGISTGTETNGQFIDNGTDFTDDVDNLTIRNNITTSFNRMGILLARNNAAVSDVVPALIVGNYITGQSGAAVAIPPPYSPFINSQFERTGIWTANNHYADITNNTITRTALGILINTHELPPQGGVATVVNNNTIRTEVQGMWVDRVSNTGGGIQISGNTVRSPYNNIGLSNPFGVNANGFRNDGYRLSYVSTLGAINLVGNNVFGARYGILTYGVEDVANILWSGGLVTDSETSIYALNWLDALPAPLTPGPSDLTISGVNISGSVLDSIAIEDIYYIDGVPGVPQSTKITLAGNTSMTDFQLSAVFVYGPESKFATTGTAVTIETGIGVTNPDFGPQPVINVFDGGEDSFDISGARVTTDRPIAAIWVTGLGASSSATLRDSVISNPLNGIVAEAVRKDFDGSFIFAGDNDITGHIVNDESTIDEDGGTVRFLGPAVGQRIDTIAPGVTTFAGIQIANSVRVSEVGDGLTQRTGPLLFNIGGNSVLERIITGLTPADENTVIDFGLTEAQLVFEPAGGDSVGLNGNSTIRLERRPVNAITPEVPSNEKFNVLGNGSTDVTIRTMRLPVATPDLASFNAAYPGPVISKTSDPARFFFSPVYSQNIPGGTGYATYTGSATEPSLTPWIEQRSDNINTPFFVSNNLTVLKVELVSFEGRMSNGGVLLTWSTASEINHAGFNVRRVSAASTSTNVDTISTLNRSLLAAQGGPGVGADYSLMDSDLLVPGESRDYMLEEVDVNGLRTFHGPVRVSYGTNSGDSSVIDWSVY